MPNPGIDRTRVGPQFFMGLADPIRTIYSCMEHDLIVELAQAFADNTIDRGSNQWRIIMLSRLGGFSQKCWRAMARYTLNASVAAQDAIRQAVATSIQTVEPALSMALSQRGYVPSVDITQQRVAAMYEQQAIDRYNTVNTVMLNATLAYYTDIVDGATRQAEAGITEPQLRAMLGSAQTTLNVESAHVVHGSKSRQQAVRDAVIQIAGTGLPGFYDKAGRQWSADAYVSMDMRTTAANAAREASFQRNSDYGNNLISVTEHVGAREGCYPYQGSVYSTDGTSGVCEELSGRKIEYTPLAQTSYGEPAGLFGINCGHFAYPFISGYSTVRHGGADKDEATNKLHYQESQKQRAQERAIRKAKTQRDAAKALGDTEAAKHYGQIARDRTRVLMDWCADKGRTFKADRLRVTTTN